MLGKSSSRLQKMIEKCSQQLGDARRRCDTCKAPLASSVWRHGSTSWIWFQSWFLTMVLWSMVIMLLSKCGPWSKFNRHESQFPVKKWFCKRNDSAKIGTCARLCGFFSKVAAWKRLVKQSPLWNWKHLTQVIAVGWFRSSPLSWFTSKKFAYKDRFQEGLDGWKCSMQVWTTNPVRMDDLAAWSRQAVNEKLDLKNDAQQHTRPSHPRMKWLCGTNTDTPYYHQQMAKAARTTWKAHVPSFFPLADWPPVCLHHTSPEMNLSATLSFAAGFKCVQLIVALRKHHQTDWFHSPSIDKPKQKPPSWESDCQTKSKKSNAAMCHIAQVKFRFSCANLQVYICFTFAFLMALKKHYESLWFWKNICLFFCFCFSSDCGEPFSQALENLCGVICREPNSLSSQSCWKPVRPWH